MKIVNRKFRREYEEVESYEAGIVLTGPEVKSIRNRALRLEDSYVRIINGEVYLINAEIPLYRFASVENYDPKRTRKLLLKKKELIRLQTKLKGGSRLTIAPKSCYNKGAIIKLEIALVAGRKEIGKRRLEKEREIQRQLEREVKEQMKR